MIFRSHQLGGIKDGTISLAFRRWEKPHVKEGGTMRSAIGVISFDKVQVVDERSITKADAKRAGFENLESMLHELNKYPGKVYKIKLSYKSEDPRIELREKTSLSDEEFQKIKVKLDRLDKTRGPWVLKTLKLIERYPERRAGDLADVMKMDRMDFKLNVRKLKNLGLTISHEVGYSISSLGALVMERL
ncbi:MAG TPA: hypothetical protein VFE50_24690 [Cyclobacteriaceae bacterium]|nr:hypothetical protein [Cyclobacteriaceae bacterium]